MTAATPSGTVGRRPERDLTADAPSAHRYRCLEIETEGALCIVRLHRPPLNILDIEALGELAEAVRSLGRAPDVAVLMLTGEGRAFSAGVDVADHTAERVGPMIDALHAALDAILGTPVPVLASLNGAALGGGLELALACDVVVARAGAELGQPEIRLGVFPPFAAAVLPRVIGRAAAMDLCLSGRTFPAEEALRLGLVQHVFDDDGFGSASRAYAHRMARLSPPVLRLTKRAVLQGDAGPPDEALASIERMYLDELMHLDDAHEGLRAFVEKRSPVWTGA